ncbi:MAG: hypothetical protein RI893_552 [Pseudomonadota bacterium]|jgi:hypothetical protein
MHPPSPTFLSIMNDDKRSHEASSLRTFFDDQLHYLQKLASSLNSYIYDEEELTKEDQLIVENFVDASNNKMRAVYDYSHKLREHVTALYHHVLQVSDQIPPPIELSLDSFRVNPIINALFVNSNDINKLVQIDHNVDVYFRKHSQYEFPILYAFLTAKKSEKQTLGMSIREEFLIHDVPQLAVNFSSHKLHVPCSSSAELNTEIKKYLFSRVVAQVKQEMLSRMISQPVKAIGDPYQSRVKSLANPDIYLDTLIEYLKNPIYLLSIEKINFKLSKLGIKLDADDKQSANEFDIHELTWSDNTKNVILQIAYTR